MPAGEEAAPGWSGQATEEQSVTRLRAVIHAPPVKVYDVIDYARWLVSAQWNVPYVSPALADPAGLPPTYVLTCGHDTLRRASEPFLGRLREAGVSTWHDMFAESQHTPLDRPGTPDGEQALRRLRRWLTGGVAAMGG